MSKVSRFLDAGHCRAAEITARCAARDALEGLRAAIEEAERLTQGDLLADCLDRTTGEPAVWAMPAKPGRCTSGIWP